MKNLIKKWWPWLITIALIVILYVIIIVSNIKTSFEITDFKISSETTNYTYTTNTTRYEGAGILTTRDKKGVYLVALKRTLVSGGSEDSEKESVIMVVVTEGKGNFSTYDYGDEGKIEKPSYKFEVIGSTKMN